MRLVECERAAVVGLSIQSLNSWECPLFSPPLISFINIFKVFILIIIIFIININRVIMSGVL